MLIHATTQRTSQTLRWVREASQSPKNPHIIIWLHSYEMSLMDKSYYRDRKISGFLGCGREAGVAANEYRVSFWDDKHVLKLTVVRVIQPLEYNIVSLNVTLEVSEWWRMWIKIGALWYVNLNKDVTFLKGNTGSTGFSWPPCCEEAHTSQPHGGPVGVGTTTNSAGGGPGWRPAPNC